MPNIFCEDGMTRVCCKCHKVKLDNDDFVLMQDLDDENETILKTSFVNGTVSHTFCPECFGKEKQLIREYKELKRLQNGGY